jgi:hypothetical protein
VKAVSIIGEEVSIVRLAQPHRLFDDRVEYRYEVPGRRIDDLQYLSSRGLLFQSLAGLGQQPRVLHRDDRLRREILQQRDLLIGERPHFLTECGNGAEDRTVSAKRDDQHTAHTAKIDSGAMEGAFR